MEKPDGHPGIPAGTQAHKAISAYSDLRSLYYTISLRFYCRRTSVESSLLWSAHSENFFLWNL